jgi:dihydropyrimidinase
MDLVIKDATILGESGAYEGSIGIKRGKIASIHGRRVAIESRRTIDASGMFVLPGIIDVHVHMGIPVRGTVSSDDFASGSIAGAFGGVTTMIDFAMQARGGSLLEALERRRAVAEPASAIDFALHCGITDWNEATRREMRHVVRSGVTSFKLFMIYKDRGYMADDGVLFECFQEAGARNAVVAVHAENPYLIDVFTRKALASGRKGVSLHALSRPNLTESEAVQRAVYLASMSDARIYICHMSTAEACHIVEEWRSLGYPVAAETCPQYLTLTEEILKRRNGHLYATCPPVRSQEDCDYLWEAIENGSVQVVSTDHCTFTRKQKALWKGDFRKIPFGLPGIETLLPILFTHGLCAGRISPETLVRVLCGSPARLFGLFPRKGSLRIGSDADLVIIDPAREVKVTPRALHMNCDYSPYMGMRLRGFPITTVLRGQVIQQDGRFLGRCGDGIFLKRT